VEETGYTVTAVESGSAGQVNVYLEGEFAFALEPEAALRYPVREGDRLTDDQVHEMLLAGEKGQAKRSALAMLSRRPYSRGELVKKLTGKGFAEPVIESVLDDLARVGLVDDKVFASGFIQNKMIQSPSGRRLLKHELGMKGVAEDDIEEALDHAFESRSEFDVARDLAEGRVSRFSNDDPRKAKQKLYEFLARRGFDWEVISAVAREVLKGGEEEG
jgi:regulatory protein